MGVGKKFRAVSTMASWAMVSPTTEDLIYGSRRKSHQAVFSISDKNGRVDRVRPMEIKPDENSSVHLDMLFNKGLAIGCPSFRSISRREIIGRPGANGRARTFSGLAVGIARICTSLDTPGRVDGAV